MFHGRFFLIRSLAILFVSVFATYCHSAKDTNPALSDEYSPEIFVDKGFKGGEFHQTTAIEDDNGVTRLVLERTSSGYYQTGYYISRPIDLQKSTQSVFVGYNIQSAIDNGYSLAVAITNSRSREDLTDSDWLSVPNREANIYTDHPGQFLFYRISFRTTETNYTPEALLVSFLPNGADGDVVTDSAKKSVGENGYVLKSDSKRSNNTSRADYTPPRDIPYPKPAIRLREEWGANDANCSSNDSGRNVLTVHHTAGYQSSYYQYGGDSKLRAIQRFHQDDRGWCDIGYHYLIGPDGIIFEGRPSTVLGAHTAGHNRRNIGISLIGYFTPPVNDVLGDPQRESLEILLAWLAYTHQIDPEGLRSSDNGDNIRVHRDWATIHNDGYNIKDCAGQNIYPLMAGFRITTSERIANDGLPQEKTVQLTGGDAIESSHPYANDTTQNFVIDERAESNLNTISLNFTSFNLENGYDFLKVIDENTGITLETFTGNLGGFQSGEYPTTYIRIEFTSDYSVTASGFAIDSYTVRKSDLPAEEIFAATFESSHPYTNNETLEYTINQPGKTWYNLYFDQFSLESNYDFLYVYDGTGNNLLKTYSGVLGQFWTGEIQSDNGLTLVFESDYSITYQGFNLQYYKTGGETVAPNGTAQNPFVIASFPAEHTGDTTDNDVGQDVWDNYSCDSSKDESGRENVYTFTAPADGNITATINDPFGVDIDVQILSGLDPVFGDDCMARHDSTATVAVTAGNVYYIAADTFNSSYGDRHGSYTLTVNFAP